ncbi:hypothetical protein BRADI_1g42601v3 [Brachypodium distachyon]|uniref:Uncharacterized protein n=1 Tax=Brachypodium distachyon TaxID=15368 RepID=A0A0Q3JLD9_BRADI|nr:hypothetical protein BRADI_1g42601v3 [Brachypodium distachyon]
MSASVCPICAAAANGNVSSGDTDLNIGKPCNDEAPAVDCEALVHLEPSIRALVKSAKSQMAHAGLKTRRRAPSASTPLTCFMTM